jgi:hypothetical protein
MSFEKCGTLRRQLTIITAAAALTLIVAAPAQAIPTDEQSSVVQQKVQPTDNAGRIAQRTRPRGRDGGTDIELHPLVPPSGRYWPPEQQPVRGGPVISAPVTSGGSASPWRTDGGTYTPSTTKKKN